MTREQAELVRQALGGSWEADHGATAAICLQAADELDVIEQALLEAENKQNRVSDATAHALQCDCDLCLNRDRHA